MSVVIHMRYGVSTSFFTKALVNIFTDELVFCLNMTSKTFFYLILKESSNVELFLLCQVTGPSPTDPNVIMDDLLTPCSPGMR